MDGTGLARLKIDQVVRSIDGETLTNHSVFAPISSIPISRSGGSSVYCLHRVSVDEDAVVICSGYKSRGFVDYLSDKPHSSMSSEDLTASVIHFAFVRVWTCS